MRSAIIAIGALLAGCQHSDVSREVGARCNSAGDCNERCLIPSTGYPNGFCTIACDTRDACPSDTTCAEREGGICLFTCTSDPDCAFLGAGWRCKATDLHGSGTKGLVCAGA